MRLGNSILSIPGSCYLWKTQYIRNGFAIDNANVLLLRSIGCREMRSFYVQKNNKFEI